TISSESESEAIGVDEYSCTALVPLFSGQDVKACVGVADPGNSNDLLCEKFQEIQQNIRWNLLPQITAVTFLRIVKNPHCYRKPGQM
ncbi:unnamed protein product, partial [Allacma fusca]